MTYRGGARKKHVIMHDHLLLLLRVRGNTQTMDGPMQTCREHSCSTSRVYERSGQDLELQDINISEESANSISDSSETEADPEDSEDTTQRSLHQKLSAIQWRKAFTLFVVAINCFLVNGSTSLLATFFPTEVTLTLKFTILFLVVCILFCLYA